MSLMRVQVRLPRDTGLSEDDVINVLHFDSDQTIAEDADDVAGRVIACYQGFDQVLSPVLTGAIHVKVYDMEQPEPRVPVFTQTGALTIDSLAIPLPEEVALCVTLRADVVPGINPQRLRGRVFVGPLAGSIQTVVGGRVEVDPTVRDLIGNAFANLCIGPDAGDGRLAVYSPTIDAADTIDAAFNDVTTVSIDNAFDTQRRRGWRATSRTNYAAA